MGTFALKFGEKALTPVVTVIESRTGFYKALSTTMENSEGVGCCSRGLTIAVGLEWDRNIVDSVTSNGWIAGEGVSAYF